METKTKIIENKEKEFTTEEKKTLETGIKLHRAMKNDKELQLKLVAQKLSPGSFDSILKEYKERKKEEYDWEALNEEFSVELNKLDVKSQEKIKEKLQSELRRKGLYKNPYTGEYSKPSEN